MADTAARWSDRVLPHVPWRRGPRLPVVRALFLADEEDFAKEAFIDEDR
jgi:hypothetical protein